MNEEHSKIAADEKMNQEQLFHVVDRITSEFVEMISSFSDEEINEVPFEGSWTAAQVADHVRKSNNGIAQSLQLKGRSAERNATERVKELKAVFLDFELKFRSPQFILPGQTSYIKGELIERLKRSIDRIKQERMNVDLSEIIDLTALGTISKTELLHFVVYHTQRHIHQLKNIFTTLKTKTHGTDQSLPQFSGNNRRGV
jgi:hypothetical protein